MIIKTSSLIRRKVVELCCYRSLSQDNRWLSKSLGNKGCLFQKERFYRSVLIMENDGKIDPEGSVPQTWKGGPQWVVSCTYLRWTTWVKGGERERSPELKRERRRACSQVSFIVLSSADLVSSVTGFFIT